MWRLVTAAWMLLAVPWPSNAEAGPARARAVWSSGPRAYVAWSDSVKPAPGDTVAFVRGGRKVAWGEIAAVVDGEMLMVRLSAGTLERAGRIDRLRVVHARRSDASRTRLRVGYPSPARRTLLFACDDTRPDPGPGSPYQPAGASEGWECLVRRAWIPAGPGLPDTLLARSFDDATDEEIALERGDLDVALFWPGEMSTRLREPTGPVASTIGVRSRGVVAITAWPDSHGHLPDVGLRPAIDPDELNQRMFRGDLVPWTRIAPTAADPPIPEAGLAVGVDDALPGAAALARFVRGAPEHGTMPRPAARLAYLPEPTARYVAPDSASATRVRPWFAIGVRVAYAPAVRAAVEAIRPDALADLIGCARGGPR
jgi:hypothetical protein